MDSTAAGGVIALVKGGFRIDQNGLRTELGYDPECCESPWCLSVSDAEGHLLHDENLDTLDAGLDRLADLGRAPRSGMRGLYRVALPDGRSFHRPGALSAEEVMSRFGHDLVGTVRAFLVAPLDSAATAADAYAWFRERLGVLGPLLGRVDPVEIDETGSCWCADVLLPANGFYRAEALLEFARSSVGACGVEMFSELGLDAEDVPPGLASAMPAPSSSVLTFTAGA